MRHCDVDLPVTLQRSQLALRATHVPGRRMFLAAALAWAWSGCGADAPKKEEVENWAPYADRGADAGLQWYGESISTCAFLDDLDGDGLDDAGWTLRESDGAAATLQVAWGDAPAHFGAPEFVSLAGQLPFLGCTVADLDRDGMADIVLSGFGGVSVLRQDSARQFILEFVPVDQPDTAAVVGMATIDLDRDGWPDVVAGQASQGHLPSGAIQCFYYVDPMDLRCAPPPGLHESLPPVILMNHAGTLVEEKERVSTLTKTPHFTPFTVATDDFDGDGFDDAFIGVDFGVLQFYRGTADGRLEEVALAGTARYGHTMGSAIGDLNGDQRPDLLATDVGPVTLLLSEPGGGFRSAEVDTGVAEATRLTVSWGARIFDADLDGALDAWVSVRHAFLTFGELLESAAGIMWVDATSLGVNYSEGLDAPENDLLLMGSGGSTPTFSTLRLPDWRAVAPRCIPTVAFADVDRDGDMDALQVYCDEARLLINETASGGAWLELDLRGTTSNRQAIGAKVIVETAGITRRTAVGGGGGFDSWSSPVVHFGLGAAHGAARLTISWPSGCTIIDEDFAVDRRVVIVEGEVCP